MKFLASAALLAATVSAFVIPDETMEASFLAPRKPEDSPSNVPSGLWDIVRDTFNIAPPSHESKPKKKHCKHAKNPLDRLMAIAERESTFDGEEYTEEQKIEDYKQDIQAWLESGNQEMAAAEEMDLSFWEPPHDGPHWGPPRRRPGPPPPHHRPGPPGKGPHHGPPRHGKPHHHFDSKNYTIYELITKTNRTAQLAIYVKKFPELAKALNSTKANLTLFVPPQHVFDKIPKNISKEFIGAALSYHVALGAWYPGKLFHAHTIPTALNLTSLDGNPQRLRVGLGLKGLNLNFFAQILRFFMPAKNGGIFALTRPLLPPPPSWVLIKLFPQEFSQLQLGLVTTGLEDVAKKANLTGSTLFAPTNFAFRKLGPRLNAFLFSEYGKKYLKALLQYHFVANETLYSDAYYSGDSVEEIGAKGYFHIDLPSTLEGKPIAVDVKSWGRWVEITLNGFTRVSVIDGIASDGAIHVISSVLIPPKKGSHALTYESEEEIANMSIEEFKSRFTGVESGSLTEQGKPKERIEL